MPNSRKREKRRIFSLKGLKKQEKIALNKKIRKTKDNYFLLRKIHTKFMAIKKPYFTKNMSVSMKKSLTRLYLILKHNNAIKESKVNEIKLISIENKRRYKNFKIPKKMDGIILKIKKKQ